jgi:bifunctional non-homologous end joining protein LigD
VVKTPLATTLYSRRGNCLNLKFPYIAAALASLPDDTIVDGEIVAHDATGRSDFALLQNFRSAETQIHYYAFDLLVLRGKDLSQRPLQERRTILGEVLKPNEHIGISVVQRGSPASLLRFVRDHGLEGVVAKRVDGVYEPGRRSGSWCKYRINLGQ